MAVEVMISIEWRQSDVIVSLVDHVAAGIVQALHPVHGRADTWHERKDPIMPGDLVRVWIRVEAANLAETERTATTVMAALDVLTEWCDVKVQEWEAFIADRAAERKARQAGTS